jgi:DNA-binding transcriptional regulator YhcF (GntR family)/DNA-binding LacI/PurR family transcriptional regulator
MEHQGTYTVNSAVRLLRETVASARRENIHKLPGSRELASQLGISRPTLKKALAILADEGKVEIVPQWGIRVCGVASPSPSSANRCKWMRIAEKIEQDIVNGLYSPGAIIPPYKELSIRYGGHYRTILRALRSLLDKKLVFPDGKRYRVRNMVYQSNRPVIIVIGLSAVNRRFMIQTPLEQDFITLFENGCRIINADHVRVGVSSTSGSIELFSNGTPFRRSALDRPVLGAVFLETGIHYADEWVRRHLESWQCPVVVIAANSGEAPASRHRFERVISTDFGTTRCSTAVARELFSLGHRHIAFISPFHANYWSRNQTLFLSQACKELGGGARVTNFLYSDYITIWDMVYATTGWTRDTLLEEINTPMNDSKGTPLPFTSKSMKHYRIYTIVTPFFEEYCMPLLKAALEDRSITAWVCPTDFTALFALDFLDFHSVPVPGRISLVSMMNTWEMVRWEIDSYNYNVPALVTAVLDYCTRSMNSLSRSSPVVCIDGGINRRKTVGKKSMRKM